MKTITASHTSKIVRITKNGGDTGNFIAMLIQGAGHHEQVLASRTFDTETGARRWAMKMLAP